MEANNRQSLNIDIACVGFGPAVGGFLWSLSEKLLNKDGSINLESKASPGMPLQILAYERADDIGFGVSGIVTKGRAIKKSIGEERIKEIPLCASVNKEELVYLLDPIGVSRRSLSFKILDFFLKTIGKFFCKHHAFKIPYIPPFLNKHGGFVLSMGQFISWVGGNLMSSGMVQLWPGTPISEPLISKDADTTKKVSGIRLMDQGTDKNGKPDAAFMPGMDILADLTVIGDGPFGSIGQTLDKEFGTPKEYDKGDWALGMKMVVELSENCTLKPGTVIHTFGYPEPEIFGFLYVYPDRLCSLGIFVPSWFLNPSRTTYRYLQHWMLHPYLWQHLKGSTLKSWGAKSIAESGLRGRPYITGNGYARIGEGAGTTNILQNSGVDEAWMSGALLAETVVEIYKSGKTFSKENLSASYEAKINNSYLAKEARAASKARDGFRFGMIPGLLGTSLSGFFYGKLFWPFYKSKPYYKELPTIEEYYKNKISKENLQKIKNRCQASRQPLHDELMTAAGWPEIPYDGKLFISHQDVLLRGGKVQAASGFKDHVSFLDKDLCKTCETKLCIEMCSGQAIMPGENGVPEFDREKCIHCGACFWNCTKQTKIAENPQNKTNISFKAGSGGLHSAEN